MNQIAKKKTQFRPSPLNQGYASDSSNAKVQDFITLLKPGVMTLVVYSAFVGLVLAPVTPHTFLKVVIIVAIALGSGAAAAFNMWYDRDIDLLMKRTCNRPIPKGYIAPQDALSFAILMTITALVLLYLASNVMAALLLGFAIFFYGYIYTVLLKRSTAQNIVIGGLAGALPPVIGWTAATGEMQSFLPWVLCLIIFLWTPSHFWALALYRSKDYEAANVPMLPLVAGTVATKIQIMIYSFLLVASTFLICAIHQTGLVYLLSASILGGVYIALAARLFMNNRMGPSMHLFTYSIFYLFLLLSALMMDQFIG